jgi:glycosyltransferase involved in cell wall biosynthesis
VTADATDAGSASLREAAVVIPIHDEEAYLPRSLAALRRALRSAVALGVRVRAIAVLDACSDGSAAVATSVPWLTVVRTTARNVGAARSLGCALALRRASVPPDRLWLALTDADSEVPFHWLTHQLVLAGRGYDAVLGTVEVRDWGGWSPDVRAAYLAGYRAGDGHGHVHGANLGVRGSAYLAAGGFGPHAADEDVALVAALRRSGARIAATGRAPVVTQARPDGRAPDGFAGHLRRLAGETATEGADADADGA